MSTEKTSKPLTETLKSLAAEMGRQVSAIIVVEMALDSDYEPYPGRTETRCDLQCALREARERLEELVERVEKLGMEVAS
jgi:hypothetical protein